MSKSMHLVCPQCKAVNRIPSNRFNGGPKCGKCRQPLFNGQPVALTATGF